MRILRNTAALMVCAGSLACVPAFAQTVTPLKGQSPEQVEADVSACQAQAQGSARQGSSSQAAGGRAQGAATAAVAGAAAAQHRANQYDNLDRIDDGVKREYRQEQAKDAAVAGAVVGGSRQRRERREDAANQEQQAAAYQQAYTSCMSARGYSVVQ